MDELIPLDDFWGGGNYIVPVDAGPDWAPPPGMPAPSRQPNTAQSYETPPWIDTINRAIERAAQVATLEVAGYPPYPQFPTPSPAPVPMPVPAPVPGVTPQPPRDGIQISTTQAIIIGLVAFAFFAGKRGR